ncbi:OmpH family outer membrane protein, partial [Arthrospira platensis SPKY1]|nr:OmpH family outer membrane protein [Arthrospira platensis SPKY1]
KKTFFTLIFIAGFLFSCQNQEITAPAESIKTAYVDTSKLIKAYNEAKDIEAKYKSKSEEMGKTLEAEVRKFRGEVENYEKNAQTYGMQWAQQKGKELQEKEQELAYTRQSMIQSLQEE